MKKKRYSWYIRPLDVHTNNIIANQLPPENFFDGALCADGKHHPLWKCEFSNIIDFQRSKKQCGLKFHIYRRVGQGKIQKLDFLFRKKKKNKTKTAG